MDHHVTDPAEILYARLDERLKAIERDVGTIRAQQAANRPQWTAVVAAIAAVAALVVTLAINL